MWISMLLDLVAPLAVFYGLRELDVNQLVALLVSGAIPTVHALYKVVRDRKFPMLAVFTMSTLAFNMVLTLITGDARLLLMRECWLSAFIGLWILLSLRAQRPAIFTVVKAIMPPSRQRDWEQSWSEFAAFRHIIRVTTWSYGLALMLCTGVQLAVVYSLPVDQVPLVNHILVFGLMIGVNLGARVYGKIHARRAGIRVKGARVLQVA